MGAQKTCRFFHFLVQIVADRGGLQIFLKLAVQCGCADPRMMDKFFQRQVFGQIFMNIFQRPLELRRTMHRRGLCGEFQKQCVTFGTRVPVVRQSFFPAQFIDSVEHGVKPFPVAGNDQVDAVKPDLFQNAAEQGASQDDGTFLRCFRFTLHGAVRSQADQENLSGIGPQSRVVLSEEKGSFLNILHGKNIGIDSLAETFSVPFIVTGRQKLDWISGALFSRIAET